jgi:hypothetical protein
MADMYRSNAFRRPAIGSPDRVVVPAVTARQTPAVLDQHAVILCRGQQLRDRVADLGGTEQPDLERIISTASPDRNRMPP